MNFVEIDRLVRHTCELIGWLLLHSIWEFTLLTALMLLLARGLAQQTARTRYSVFVAGLMLFPMSIVITLIWFPNPVDSATRTPLNSGATFSGVLPEHPYFDPMTSSTQTEYDKKSPSISDTSTDGSPQTIHDNSPKSWVGSDVDRAVRTWLSIGALLWSCGVFICSVRLGLGYVCVRRLFSVDTSPLPESVQRLADQLKRGLSIRQSVRFFHSNRIDSPVVAGCFKSVILIPTSILTNMPVEQLEALLLHELIHVRRYDFAVNMVQLWIESIFFYHPGVWWLSNQIRLEREYCVDDEVIAAVPNRVEYGNALLEIETRRRRRLLLSIGANDGPLLRRVRRLFAPATKDTSRAVTLPIFALLLFLFCMANAAHRWLPQGFAVDFRDSPDVATSAATQDVDAEKAGADLGAAQDPQRSGPLSSKTWSFIKERPKLDLPKALAASELPLWHQYLKAIEGIRNVSCAFSIQYEGRFDYTENTDDGYYIAHKYESYVWDVPTGHFIAEHLVYNHESLPPHDWGKYTTFHSDTHTGMFFFDQFWGNRYHASRHWVPRVPHPMSFVASGPIQVPDYFDTDSWTVSEADNRLILKSVQVENEGDLSVTIELSADHDQLPKEIEITQDGANRFLYRYVVDRFEQVDGLWFPVEMRVESFRDDGRGMSPIPFGKIRILVEESTIKLNQELDAAVYRFEFPPGALWEDLDTGERVEGEIGMQRSKAYREEIQRR